jgi:galactokinase
VTYRSVPLPDSIELVILHSGVTHSLASHDGGTRNYRTRRLECERACELLGVKSLRDLTEADLERVNALPEPFNRRARHVITENARVLQAVTALESGDLERVGALFYASHASMRDDYDVSEPEIDTIVELARGTPGIYGARLTGGGFGGSVVMLAARGTGRAAGESIAGRYVKAVSRTPRLLSPA